MSSLPGAAPVPSSDVLPMPPPLPQQPVPEHAAPNASGGKLDWRAVARRWWAYAACAALLVLFGVLSYTAVLGKAATYDEPLHVVGGFLHVNFDDYRINPEDPALFGMWSALPHSNVALSVDITSPSFLQATTNVDKQWPFVVSTLYSTPENAPDWFLNTSRAMFTFIGVACGVVLAWWSWRLAGAVAAVIAVFCFAFDPNFLAHASLVKNDVALSLFTLAAAFAIWAFGRDGSWWKLLVLGLVIGGAINVKFSGILLAPIIVTMLIGRAVLPVPWRVLSLNLATIGQRLWAVPLVAVLVLLVSWAVTWAVYGFRFTPTRDGEPLNMSAFIEVTRYRELIAQITAREGKPRAPTQEEFDAHGASAAPILITWMNERRMLPQAWLFGFLYTYATTRTRSSFLMGRNSLIGFWYYFPMAMLFKTALATLLAMFGAAAFSLGRLIFPPLMDWEEARRSRVPSAPVDRLNADTARGHGVLDAQGNRNDDAMASPAATPRHHGTIALTSAAADHARRELPESLWAMICLIVPPAIYGFAALMTNLNLGLRHVLPIYPFLYIGIALVTLRLLRLGLPWAKWVVAVLAVGLAAETLTAYPNYLAFFNVASGGSRGGRYLLADSNLDWGQDLINLAEWRKKHMDKPLLLSYFGMANPEYYGLEYTNVAGGYIFRNTSSGYVMYPAMHLWELPQRPAYLVVSATNLQCVYMDEREMKALQDIKPREVLNGTIYIYDWPLPTGPVQPPSPKQ